MGGWINIFCRDRMTRICPFGHWAIWLTLREASRTKCGGDISYNHSVRYALDGVALTVQFNANSLFRKMTNF